MLGLPAVLCRTEVLQHWRRTLVHQTFFSQTQLSIRLPCEITVGLFECRPLWHGLIWRFLNVRPTDCRLQFEQQALASVCVCFDFWYHRDTAEPFERSINIFYEPFIGIAFWLVIVVSQTAGILVESFDDCPVFCVRQRVANLVMSCSTEINSTKHC